MKKSNVDVICVSVCKNDQTLSLYLFLSLTYSRSLSLARSLAVNRNCWIGESEPMQTYNRMMNPLHWHLLLRTSSDPRFQKQPELNEKRRKWKYCIVTYGAMLISMVLFYSFFLFSLRFAFFPFYIHWAHFHFIGLVIQHKLYANHRHTKYTHFPKQILPGD